MQHTHFHSVQPGGTALPKGGGGNIWHKPVSGSVRSCLSPTESAWLGLPESSRHLLFTRPQACQEFGAQGTTFLCFGVLIVWGLLTSLSLDPKDALRSSEEKAPKLFPCQTLACEGGVGLGTVQGGMGASKGCTETWFQPQP